MKEASIKKSNRIKDGSKTVTVFMYIIAAIICLVTVYPMYYVIIKSISDPILSLTGHVTLFPKGLYFGTYALIVSDANMWKAYANTLIYVTSGTALMLITSVLGAYPLVTNKLIGRKWVVRFLIIPLYFSGGIIPHYLLINWLHMYDKYIALIIPGAVSVMNIILTRTFFTTIPTSLSESAEIDGADSFKILYNIFIPLSKPVLAVIAIYTIVNIWNNWFSAMIYLPSTDKHPLQMYLHRVLVSQTVDLTELMSEEEFRKAREKVLTASQLKYAIIVFVSLPIIFIYPMFQKHFMKGVMLGSLKG